MRTIEAIKYFGTQQAVADALGLKQPAVSLWGERPPSLRQLQLEIITKGKLKADPEIKQPSRERAA
jgi:transcriptional repressor of cell division inhibition gene dicB